MATLDAFFADIQKKCLPGIWSKGVALSRSDAVQQDSAQAHEIVLRVRVPDRPVSPKVTLWPEDEDCFCDCGDRNEICAHIAASIIALKSGQIQKRAEVLGPSSVPRILYRFLRDAAGSLRFERSIEHADREIPIPDTLVAFVGGISSGRIVLPALPATREDFAIDGVLNGVRDGVPDRSQMPRLLQLLSHSQSITLDGQVVRVDARPTGLRIELVDAPGGGFAFKSEMDTTIREVFANGAALCGPDRLSPLQLPSLNPAENAAIHSAGKIFRSPSDIQALVTDLLPGLEKKLPVAIRTEKLPQPILGAPKVSLRLENTRETGEELLVVATIGYPEAASPGEVLIPQPQLEAMLARKLQSDLHLSVGQPVRFRGSDAIDFVLKLQSSAGAWSIQGDGARRFGIAQNLTPQFEVNDGGFRLSFMEALSGSVSQAHAGTIGGGLSAGHSTQASSASPTLDGRREADPARVLQAWRDGSDYVPLIGGGFAPLPLDWLKKFGPRISALFEALSEARKHRPEAKLPAHLLPELAELGDTLGAPLPEALKQLRAKLQHHEGIPHAALPTGLRAKLRDYQQKGVDWLVMLRDSGMGALLADDMGLGKTLQALCAIQGQTLVVCPTSVLSAWSGQIARFRPDLRVRIYHGPGRELAPISSPVLPGALHQALPGSPPGALPEVTLTTYSVMRLDREALGAREWDTLILDEAQTIKNPSSQVARAAHELRVKFRIALSGTPVENRLEDLWSQFQFVNPGLLGSRRTFQEEFGQAITRGEADATARLRSRIKPFLLRRLKREVASELPPRTETVLHCELSEPERELYDSLLASSRKEVIQKLEQGASVFAALELLLRLRQACCSPALVPGGADRGFVPSSKISLLRENLEESVALGHRALVFSQWTSLLDQIEPELKAAGLGFLRLDGSTRDREAIVSAFQKNDGPPVLLISLKAGGTGLTLTAADHVYLMDPWWNPAVEDQAADRAHRIGQENPVLIQRMVARDTVEDRILALQKRKQELAGAVLEGSGGAISLTQDDLLALLE